MDAHDTTAIYPVARMSSRCHPSSRLLMLERDKGQSLKQRKISESDNFAHITLSEQK